MFENAELGHTLPPARFDARLPKLRARLLQTHFALRARKFPVIVIVSGADGAGKGELVHRLNEWLDPRGVETHAFWQPSDEERERPEYWRFWRAMPGRGRIGIFFGSWYSAPIIRRAFGETKAGKFDAALDRIAAFEKMLTDDGALIVKLWLHLPKKQQKKRLKKLEADGRLAPDDWKHFKLYDEFTAVSERALRRTHAPRAPWHVIEATDRRYREITAGEIILSALRKKLAEPAAAAKPAAPSVKSKMPVDRSDSILAHVDLAQKLTETEYARQLETQQAKLSKLAWAAHRKGRSMVLMFEGWDAAGKGSAIRRVTQAIDPRLYRVVGIAAPTDEERAQHYLWRFWRHLPRAGHTTIFDRSWYNRAGVERVFGFCTQAQTHKFLTEAPAFEALLARDGILIIKFFLSIGREMQMKRLHARWHDPLQRWKLSDLDFQAIAKWDDYSAAFEQSLAQTDSAEAPWTVIRANDKRRARLEIIRHILSVLPYAKKDEALVGAVDQKIVMSASSFLGSGGEQE